MRQVRNKNLCVDTIKLQLSLKINNVAFNRTEHLKYESIIQLMHSFEVDIRIYQPENSDVHRGEAEVNIIFEG